MIAALFRNLTSVSFWGIVCLLFSMFISTGAIRLGAMILVLLYGLIAVMLGPHFIAVGWLVGSPTVFGFPNEILRALPFVTMERLIFGVLLVIIFLQYAFLKRRTAWLPLEVAIVVFLVYALVSLALHTDSIRWRQDGWLLIQYLMPLGSFIISRRLVWSERGLTILLGVLTFAGVFVAVIGVLQSQFGISLFTMNYQTIVSGHVGRAHGTFSSAHTFVATLFIFLTITLLQFNVYKDSMVRLILIGSMAVIALGIFLGVSRGPWIGATLAFIVIFIKHPQARPLMIVGGLFAMFAGVMYFILLFDQLGYLMERLTNVGTLKGRAAIWATAVNMVAHNPLFGLGFGSETFSLHKYDYISGIGSLTAQYAVYLGIPHNEYLNVAVMLGLTGLVLFLIILFQLIRLMFRIHADRNESDLRRHLALYVGAIVIGLMFNSFFSDTYMQDYFWILTYFLAGIAAGNLSKAPATQAQRRQKEAWLKEETIESAG